MTARMIAAIAGVALFVSGCGGAGTDGGAASPSTNSAPTSPSPGEQPWSPQTSTTPTAAARLSALTLAGRIRAAVPAVTKVVQVTKDNDPNDKIGRPNGYTDAAVIYDTRRHCDSLGVDCEATIEIWPASEDAKTRAAYIQDALKNAPALGTEYDYLREGALLRVPGTAKPSEARAHCEAFGGQLFEQ